MERKEWAGSKNTTLDMCNDSPNKRKEGAYILPRKKTHKDYALNGRGTSYLSQFAVKVLRGGGAYAAPRECDE
jgi:hypothetical protein